MKRGVVVAVATAAVAVSGALGSSAAATPTGGAGARIPAPDFGSFVEEDSLHSPKPRSSRAWSEPDWCAKRAPLGDLARSYDPRDPRPTLLEIAKRRYPPAVPLIEAAPDDRLRYWLRPLPGKKNDLKSVVSLFANVVHEEGHALTWPGANPPSVFAYRIVDDSSVVLVPGVEAYPRSQILRRHPSPATDPYAKAYLEGPMGGQDIEMLTEEFVQYVHSLASGFCAYDVPSNTRVSYRDGVLTHMWWMQMYLAVGRKHHPQDYRAILANKALVTVIIDTWRRAEHWLAKTRGTNYGIDDAALLARVSRPANKAEIDRLRRALHQG
ncbi:MAG: hypothetical protein FJW85_00090 [Actinobacteria bacterium]|nr:hypothetical protein [Actinomycetota bacterium]